MITPDPRSKASSIDRDTANIDASDLGMTYTEEKIKLPNGT